jgi:cell division protein FtsN
VQKPAAKKTPPARTPEPRVTPSAQGQYAVQVGAFGEAVNADNEAARLKTLGWDARVRAGNNSSGEMVFRVWIGYFSSRQSAQTFINQNSKQLSGAIPVHR